MDNPVEEQIEPWVIDAGGMHYRTLNAKIREFAAQGVRRFVLNNVRGQRYICAGLSEGIALDVFGTPGEDLGVFMAGPSITVHGNAQNAVGNTMSDGRILVGGLAGDVIGYAMRGGRIYVRDDVGYRVGIHMKGYADREPTIVVGGTAGDFLGEYMAGGCLVVLGATTDRDRPIVGDHCAAGMHGGRMYLRGRPGLDRLGKEVEVFPLDDQDISRLVPILHDFCQAFDVQLDVFDFSQYCKILPVSTRPYGRLYTY
jgi:glutamate synthase domain-containing protein 3